MKDGGKKVVIVIPARNEEAGLSKVLSDLVEAKPRIHASVETIVVDNASTDNTASVARGGGARVVSEPRPGKGNAIQTGFRCVPADADYVVMVDGDHTYSLSELPRMLEPIQSGFADAILGSRLSGNITDGSMTIPHRIANWLFTFAVRHLYRANVTDICTGYFAWDAKALRALAPQLTSTGFTLETEMVTKMARMGQRIYSVPITYQPRKGESKISPFKDGTHIVATIIRNLRWKPVR